MPKKHRIEFREVLSPISDAATKFGGQPVWVSEPQWPSSRETANPMRFLCQIRLDRALFPGTAAEMAYLFMTDEDDGRFVDETFEPNGGENAVILQPGVTQIPTRPLSKGPTLYRMTEKPGFGRLQPEFCEFAVTLIEEEDVEFVPEGERMKMLGAEWTVAEWEEVKGKLENKVGGTPQFLQYDDFPFNGKCPLLVQLDSCDVPFFLNFGGSGVGYAFLNEAGDNAKFLWQCT